MACTADVRALYDGYVVRFAQDLGLRVDAVVANFLPEEFFQLYVRVTGGTGNYTVKAFETLATAFFAITFDFSVADRCKVLAALINDTALFGPLSWRVHTCIRMFHGDQLFCAQSLEEAVSLMKAQVRLVVGPNTGDVTDAATSRGGEGVEREEDPFFPSSLSPAPTPEPRVICPVARRASTHSQSPLASPSESDPGLPTSHDPETKETFGVLLPMFRTQLSLTKSQVWEQVITPGVATVVQQLAYHSRSVRRQSATLRMLTLIIVRFLCVIPQADHDRFLRTVGVMASTIKPCRLNKLLGVSRTIVLETERNPTLSDQVCGMMALLPAVYCVLRTEAKMVPAPLKRLSSESTSDEIRELHDPLRSYVVPILSMVKLKPSWKTIHGTPNTTRKRNQTNGDGDDDDEWLPNKRQKHLGHQ